MDYKTPLNELLKYYRNRLGISQDTLAEKSGVSPSTIKQIESPSYIERKTIDLDTIFKLCVGLEIPADYIINPLWQIHTGQAKTVLEIFDNEEG